MISLPLISREFRVAARRKRTFVLRTVCGVFLTGAVGMFLLGQMISGNSQAMGRSLLTTLSWQLSILILILMPALACGAIADERKQGTLGLLFLTHLNSADIVIGKFVGKAFDALMLVLSVSPLLFVPILLGGVSWEQTLSMVAAILAVLLLSLSAAVFFSAISASTGTASVLTYVALVAYNLIAIILPQLKHASFSKPLVVEFLKRVPDWMMLASPLCPLWRGQLYDSLISLLLCAAVSVVLLVMAMLYLARFVRFDSFRVPLWHRWRRRTTASGDPKPRRVFNREALDRNPLAWLYFGRIGTRWLLQLVLGGGLFLYVGYELVVSDFKEGLCMFLFIAGLFAAYALKVLMVLKAARSFATEKEDGALELILTSPFPDRQIVHGKLLAVLGNYGLVYGVVIVLIVMGGLGLLFQANTIHKEAVLIGTFFIGTTLTGLLWAVCAALLISAWSRSVKQAITLSVLLVVLLGWGLFQVTYFGVAIVFSLAQVRLALGPNAEDIVGAIIIVGRIAIDLVIAFVAWRLLTTKLRVYAAR